MKTILLIEDNKTIIDLIVNVLYEREYKVSIAVNGIQGIKIAQRIIPDLILLDILMPEMDGYETCRILKESELTNKIPVIFLSALTKSFNKVKAFQLGAVDFISKPIDVEELWVRVNTHLTISSLQRELEEMNEKLEEKVATRTKELQELNLHLQAFIEELFQKTRALKESEERFMLLAELTFEGILIHKNGIIMDLNKSLEKMSGYAREELVGKNLFDFIASEKSKKLIESKLNLKYTAPYEIELQRNDGTIIPVEIEAVQIVSNLDNFKVAALRDLTERKESEKKILNAVIEAEEKERERFSRELHDGIGPLLSTLKMYFQWLCDTQDPEKIATILKNGQENLEEAISAVGEISNNISPRTLNSFGLKAALRTFLGRIKHLEKVQMELDCNFSERIDQNIEVTVYRIITELINNTLKYADASQIKILIHLDWETEKLFVNYTDNGKGFDFEKILTSNRGLGLVNIQQRIKILGGRLDFKTGLGIGIDVKFECKLKQKR